MPNLYEKVVAIPDQPPVQLSGTLPAGSCSGFPPAIPFGQILILSGASAGVWNVNPNVWTQESHTAGLSVQVKVTQGDKAGWYVRAANGTSFDRI